MPTDDAFQADARALLELLRKHDVAAIDDAVGDDADQIKEDVIAEWLRGKYGK